MLIYILSEIFLIFVLSYLLIIQSSKLSKLHILWISFLALLLNVNVPDFAGFSLSFESNGSYAVYHLNSYVVLAKTIVTLIYLTYTLITNSPSAGSYPSEVKTNQTFAFYYLQIILLLSFYILLSSYDFILLYIGMELLALSSYLLACLQIGTSSTPDHNEGLAYEASLKYYIMGSISSSFFLLGTSLVYAVQGSINFGHLIDTGVSGYSTYLSIIGFIFILFYFLFKLSIFPFHQWTPDVFQGVSLDVTAFLAILPKSTFYLLLPYIVFNLSLPLLGNSDGSSVLYALPFGAFLIALLSITLGSFMGLLQSNIKRIIAYSSITNGGFLLLGVSTNSFLGYNSYFFYLIVYLISNLNLFAAILWKGQSLSVLDFKSLVYRNPIYAANFLLILFSLAGIPPFAGFLAKFQIFNSLANYLLPNGSPSSLFIILFFALFLSLFASFYYLRLIHFFYFYEPNAPLSNDADIPNLSIAYLLSITSLAVIFFGIYPYPLIEFSNYLTFCLGWAF